ncbi:OmpA family protein [Rhodococcus opacus]|uniref:OmpA family protein n=1 Tax=Rhodococcus TaxID=1827 RepID=UPI00146B457C|nr:OmpA family protein [Rhodococcus sp. IEGM 1351]MDI9934080.1 OmpA family protein [Rhodococcus sp. IEGM 1351]WKN58060.1 OmpA family protein [Rhodococcus opacus]
MRKTIVTGIAVAAIALLGAAGCSDDSSNEAPIATTTTSSASDRVEGAISSVQATASSAVNTAREATQNAINSAISAVPIGFESGTAELNAISDVTVSAVAAALNASDNNIRIEAYAANSDESAAELLADQRAQAVANALEAKGVDKSRISVEGTANPPEGVNADQVEITVEDS